MKRRVLAVTALLVVVLISCFAAVGIAAEAKPHAAITPVSRHDDWWQARHKAMNDRVKQGNVDLILIGDSITHAWEGEGKAVWDEFYAKRNAVNLGISGDQTQHVLWRLDNGNIDGISPKLAVMMIGTNNSGSDTPEHIADGVKAIVDKLRAKLPKTKVLILAIFPRGPNAADPLRQTNQKANQIIAKLADGKMVEFMDIGDRFLKKDGTLTKDVMPDLLHLNPASYRVWAEAIEPVVAKAFAPDVKPHAAITPVPKADDWWQARHKAMNDRVKQGNVDLIMIGDSITHGWEGEGKAVWDEFYGKRNAVNLGIGGDQTQHVLWRLDNGNIDGISPKLAVLMIGTNNASAGNTPEQIADGVKAIVEKLRAKLPKTKVLVLAIFPRGPNVDDRLRQVNQKANEIIAKLADGQMVEFTDIGKRFLKEDGTLTKDVMPDLLHLNPASYRVWAEAIEPVVAKAFAPDTKPHAAITPVPKAAEAWWMARHKAMNDRVKQGNVDLILIGDSITQRWEGPGKDAWNAHYGKRNAVNLGIDGDRTEHVLWRLDNGNIDGIAPKLAVVMIGTNNSTDTPEHIADGVKAIVEKLRAKLPKTKVLLLAIFPSGANDADAHRQLTRSANKLIAKLADGDMVQFMDIGGCFVQADGTPTKGFLPDLVHLTPVGYEAWAEAIEPAVAKAFAGDNGFVSLFDGKTLDGWHKEGGGATYRVEGDCIVGEVGPGNNTFLCTKKNYGDFILKLDVKFDVPGNSGIQLRSHQRSIDGRVFGYQCEIDPSPRAWSGGIYDESRRNWLYSLEGREEARKAFKLDGWNEFVIEAMGPSIKTWINGVPCADLNDKADADGFIALQVHSGTHGKIRWRNIRIRELKPAK